MQIDMFTNMPLDNLAIELIRAYEPPEGYSLGFSGGKDSCVILHLTERAGVKFKPIHNVSPIDPPILRNFIKLNYPDVIWEYHAKNFWGKHLMANGLPLKNQRWCCRLIKEAGGIGKVNILGIRKAESLRRRKYGCFNVLPTFSQLLPILNWSDADVWQYIGEHNITFSALYRHGFKRIGCVLCPFKGKYDIKRDIQMFPEIVKLWRLGADRYVAKRLIKNNGFTFKTGEEYFNWWVTRKGQVSNAQCIMFDN